MRRHAVNYDGKLGMSDFFAQVGSSINYRSILKQMNAFGWELSSVKALLPTGVRFIFLGEVCFSLSLAV